MKVRACARRAALTMRELHVGGRNVFRENCKERTMRLHSRSVRRTVLASALVGFLVAGAFPRPSNAHVVAFIVEQRRSFASGMSWGSAGPYERLDGTAYFEVDPRDTLNAGIVN